MTVTYQVVVEGIEYSAVLSDDSQALLAAAAAGSAVVGLWQRGSGRELGMARYLVERPQDADPAFLEKVVRRTYGLPLTIAVTDRLNIREFKPGDISRMYREAEDSAADRLFYDEVRLDSYIRSQYGFFEYGLWALEDRMTGNLVGKAGVVGTAGLEQDGADGLELGYHIYTPYRRRGYALEACRAIIRYVGDEFLPACLVIKTDASNKASVNLADKLGFIKQKYTGAVTMLYLTAENY